MMLIFYVAAAAAYAAAADIRCFFHADTLPPFCHAMPLFFSLPPLILLPSLIAARLRAMLLAADTLSMFSSYADADAALLRFDIIAAAAVYATLRC